MQVMIIEDEKPAAEKLKKALLQYDAEIGILQMPTSVRDAAEWLQRHPCPDLIFMDIESTDGLSFRIFDTLDIAYCYSAYKLVFLIEVSGQKHIVDRSLNDLEKELDPAIFFRVNRKYLVKISQIRKIKTLLKGKLWLDLNPKAGEEIIVSQERAAAVKIWIGN